MNGYDTIKIKFPLDCVESFTAAKFDSKTDKHGITSQFAQLGKVTGLNSVKLCEANNEVTIEFSAKILKASYPQLLTLATIRPALETINSLGLVAFDVEKVLGTGKVLKCHQTQDFGLLQPLQDYARPLLLLNVADKWDLRDESGKGSSIRYLRQTKRNGEVLKIYNKWLEYNTSPNWHFRNSLTTSEKTLVASQLIDKTRAELSVIGSKKIQRHYKLNDECLLKDLLASEVNALATVFNNITTQVFEVVNDSEEININEMNFINKLDLDELERFSALKAVGFCWEKMDTLLKTKCKKTTLYKRRPLYREMLMKWQQQQQLAQPANETAGLLGELKTAINTTVRIPEPIPTTVRIPEPTLSEADRERIKKEDDKFFAKLALIEVESLDDYLPY